MRPALLIVDDDVGVHSRLTELLSTEYALHFATTIQQALDLWRSTDFALIITEKSLPDGPGSRIAEYGGLRAPHTPIIMMSVYASVESMVEALHSNVVDYVVKPIRGPAEVALRVRRALQPRARNEAPQQHQNTRQGADQLLASLTVRDPLTGLYNHAYFQETLDREIRRTLRAGESLSLVIADIDHFKVLNDSRGHTAGDSCLKHFAGILTGKLRDDGAPFSLRAQDIVARYSGDRFGLLLPDTLKRGAATKAEQLRAYIEAYDFTRLGFPPQTVSIGVAACPDDADDRQGLIQAAERAATLAKQTGRNRIITHSEGLAAPEPAHLLAARLDIDSLLALDTCLAQRSFSYAYQPIVDAASETIFGYEALCRSSEASFPGPDVLFSTAERAGRVSELGSVVRGASLTTMQQLSAPHLLFLNLHPLELNERLFEEARSTLLPLAPRLVFEITESAVIRDVDRLKLLMKSLRDLGYRFALDDLGAGYAGLNSLAMLEPEFVKLDMALIRGIQHNSRSARLIKHILEFTTGEGILAVAEGVETVEEFQVVQALGCPLVQGFYFARPGPAFPQLAH